MLPHLRLSITTLSHILIAGSDHRLLRMEHVVPLRENEEVWGWDRENQAPCAVLHLMTTGAAGRIV